VFTEIDGGHWHIQGGAEISIPQPKKQLLPLPFSSSVFSKVAQTHSRPVNLAPVSPATAQELF